MIKRILNLIEETGINAYKLTNDLGLDKSAVAQWKSGKAKPSTDAIIKIAAYFGVTTDWLLTGQGSKFSNKMERNNMANTTTYYPISITRLIVEAYAYMNKTYGKPETNHEFSWNQDPTKVDEVVQASTTIEDLKNLEIIIPTNDYKSLN